MPKLIGIGSILNEWYYRPCLVFGSGFLNEIEADNRKQILSKDLRVIALRGRLSLAELEKMGYFSNNQIVLGDPGLLVSRFFCKEEVVCTDLLVILHYIHSELYSEINFYLSKSGLKYKIISADNSWELVAREIKKARKVVSTSLHGIIFAHAYNRIAYRLVIEDIPLQGGDFKFLDYLSVYCAGIEQEILERITLPSITSFFKYDSGWRPEKNQIEKIQSELVKTFGNWQYV